MSGGRKRFDKMRNFPGPGAAPQKIALAVPGERTLFDKTRDFLGTPLDQTRKSPRSAE
jgi:hypothetical protein